MAAELFDTVRVLVVFWLSPDPGASMQPGFVRLRTRASYCFGGSESFANS
jgi:hypothetical protein